MKKILIINLGGLGDMLFSLPFLKGLRKKYPDAKITLLAVTNSYPVIENQNLVDEVVELPATTGDIRGFRGFRYFGVLQALRRERFDIAINLRTIVTLFSGFKVALIMAVIGARKTAGRNSEGFGWFYNYGVSEGKRFGLSDLDYHSALADKLGFKARGRPSIKLTKKEKKLAGEFFNLNKINPDERLILINTESRRQSTRWPLNNFIKLIGLLSKIPGIRIGVIYHRDLESVRRIKQKYKKVFFLDGIMRVAAVMSRSELLISNDTGIIHIGAAVNIKTIGIYSSTAPSLTGPALPRNRKIIIYNNVKCSPCNKTECSSLECLKKISVEDVFKAAKKLVNPRAR